MIWHSWLHWNLIRVRTLIKYIKFCYAEMFVHGIVSIRRYERVSVCEFKYWNNFDGRILNDENWVFGVIQFEIRSIQFECVHVIKITSFSISKYALGIQIATSTLIVLLFHYILIRRNYQISTLIIISLERRYMIISFV